MNGTAPLDGNGAAVYQSPLCGQPRHRSRRSAKVAGLLLALAAGGYPLRAWDDLGHKVVAKIAWDQLSEPTRQEAVRLLEAVPEEAELKAPSCRGPERCGQALWEQAAIWPDLARGNPVFDRPSWHYINFFWESGAGGGPPVARPDLKPAPENVVEALGRLAALLGDRSRPDRERGLALAWILHLVGDLHQPLHTSARVTSFEPKGDRGGNDFLLGVPPGESRPSNLHFFWDSLLTQQNPKPWWLGASRFVDRLARELERAHPRQAGASGQPVEAFEEWAEASAEIAKRELYPPELLRNQAPPATYQKRALALARPAIALAGYRLGALVEARLASATQTAK